MGFRDKIKNLLPAYRVGKQLSERIEQLKGEIHDLSDKNEYMF